MSTSEEPGRPPAISTQDLRRIVRGEVRKAVLGQHGDNPQTSSDGKESGSEEPAAVTPAHIRTLIRQELSAVQNGHSERRHGNSATGEPAPGSDRTTEAPQSEPAKKSLTASDVKRLIRQALRGRSRPRSDQQGSGKSSGARNDSHEPSGMTTVSPEEVRTIVHQELRDQKQPVSGQPSSAHQRKPSSSSDQAHSTSASHAPSPSLKNVAKAAKSSSSNHVGHDATGSSDASSSHGAAGDPAQAQASSQSAEAIASVLTEAQWQLSQELEANLKQLRQVINQSQEVARKIERVLGKGTKGSQGSS